MKTIESNMKPAIVENIILWIILFVSFASLVFFIVSYAMSLKVIDKVNALSDYGARAVSLDRTDSEVITGLNAIKTNSFNTIISGNLTCTETTGTENYQVEFNTYTTYTNNFLGNQGANNIHGKRVVFNETSSTEKVCNLYITIGN